MALVTEEQLKFVKKQEVHRQVMGEVLVEQDHVVEDLANQMRFRYFNTLLTASQ
jgi:hypothetical protein